MDPHVPELQSSDPVSSESISSATCGDRQLPTILGFLARQSPWWFVSVSVHVFSLSLLAILTFRAPAEPSSDDGEVVIGTSLCSALRSASISTTTRPHSVTDTGYVFASDHESPPNDPTSVVASDIVVPPDILARTELGDHFETINQDRPDTQSAFGVPDARMFHDSAGVADGAGGGAADSDSLEDVIGADLGQSPGVGVGGGGGWGGGEGTGIGVDCGFGRGSFGQRIGGGRRLMVQRHGGSRSCEGGAASSVIPAKAKLAPGATRETMASVQTALKWLANNQTAEGRWDCSAFGGRSNDTTVTGLSLLAFLSGGNTEAKGLHRESVRRAVEWLCRQQDGEGRLGVQDDGRGYAHPIAGLSLTEAVRNGSGSETVDVAKRALEWSCHERRAPYDLAGSWRYDGGQSNGDLSVSGWYLLQLRAAETAGLNVPDECFSKASSFLDSVSTTLADGPQGPIVSYAYKPGSHGNARLDAVGNTCRQLLNVAPERMEAGVQYLVRTGGLPSTGKADLYYWYYGTLCTYRHGGEVWNAWNEAMKKTLLRTQQRAGPKAGSWNPEGPYSGDLGRVGQTALSALCLEVYYRFQPKAVSTRKPTEAAVTPFVPNEQRPVATVQAMTIPQPAPSAKPGDEQKPVADVKDEVEPEVPGTEAYTPVIEKGFTFDGRRRRALDVRGRR